MTEALETAREVKKKENEDKIRKKCNEIKETFIKELFQLLYNVSSQSVMADISNYIAFSLAKRRAILLTFQNRVSANLTKFTYSSSKL